MMRLVGFAAVFSLTTAFVLDQHTEDSDAVRTVLTQEGIWQQFQPQWSSELAEIHLELGSIQPCRKFKGTLSIYKASPKDQLSSNALEDVTESLLHSQDVETTCDQCQVTSHTCLMAPACSAVACLSWQRFQLDVTVPVQINETYVFVLSHLASVDSSTPAMPSVGVSVASTGYGGLSNLPFNARLIQPHTQYTFKTMMTTQDTALLKNHDVNTASSTSGTSLVPLFAIAGVVLFVAFVVFFVMKRSQAKLSTVNVEIIEDTDSQPSYSSSVKSSFVDLHSISPSFLSTSSHQTHVKSRYSDEAGADIANLADITSMGSFSSRIAWANNDVASTSTVSQKYAVEPRSKTPEGYLVVEATSLDGDEGVSEVRVPTTHHHRRDSVSIDLKTEEPSVVDSRSITSKHAWGLSTMSYDIEADTSEVEV